MRLKEPSKQESLKNLRLIFGLFHGIAVSTVLAKLLGEHHPVERYQVVTTKVVLAHIFAHVLYGLVIGTMYGTYIAS